jgi:two-component system, cell cycle sensor histidine kinase and response regulator CckA
VSFQETPVVSPKGGTETILVVDDEEGLRNILVRGLREEGYRVLEAANGRQAIEIVERSGNQLDLVISDVAMPELNGADLARFTLPKYPNLPFIFISGQPRETLTQIAQIDEAATLLEKPFTHDQLAAVVRETLDRKTVPSRSG